MISCIITFAAQRVERVEIRRCGTMCDRLGHPVE